MPTLKQLAEKKPTRNDRPSRKLVLDHKTLLFQPGKITVVGSRPGMGRTLLMLYLFSLLHKQNSGLQHHYITNEEEAEGLYQKLFSTVTGLNYQMPLVQRNQVIFEHPVLFSDKVGISAIQVSWENLKSSLEEKLKKEPIDFLYLDKIQGMFSEKSFRNREQELHHIISELRIMSQKYQISTIIASSLNRFVDNRTGRRPYLSDLRDTGALEDLTDLILLLFRQEYYGFTEDEYGNNLEGVAEVSIAKNRMGETGTIRLSFDKNAPCFKPYEGSTFSFTDEFRRL